eukprot:7689947-Alexandrium_andersonii.AAC.1
MEREYGLALPPRRGGLGGGAGHAAASAQEPAPEPGPARPSAAPAPGPSPPRSPAGWAPGNGSLVGYCVDHGVLLLGGENTAP